MRDQPRRVLDVKFVNLKVLKHSTDVICVDVFKAHCSSSVEKALRGAR